MPGTSQNELLTKLVQQHIDIIRCEMKLDQLQEEKQELIAEWFSLPEAASQQDDVEGWVLTYEGHAYVIQLRKELYDTGEPRYSADIQRMKLVEGNN